MSDKALSVDTYTIRPTGVRFAATKVSLIGLFISLLFTIGAIVLVVVCSIQSNNWKLVRDFLYSKDSNTGTVYRFLVDELKTRFLSDLLVNVVKFVFDGTITPIVYIIGYFVISFSIALIIYHAIAHSMHTCRTYYILGAIFLAASVFAINVVLLIGVILYLLSPNAHSEKFAKQKEGEVSDHLNFSVHSISLWRSLAKWLSFIWLVLISAGGLAMIVWILSKNFKWNILKTDELYDKVANIFTGNVIFIIVSLAAFAIWIAAAVWFFKKICAACHDSASHKGLLLGSIFGIWLFFPLNLIAAILVYNHRTSDNKFKQELPNVDIFEKTGEIESQVNEPIVPLPVVDKAQLDGILDKNDSELENDIKAVISTKDPIIGEQIINEEETEGHVIRHKKGEGYDDSGLDGEYDRGDYAKYRRGAHNDDYDPRFDNAGQEVGNQPEDLEESDASSENITTTKHHHNRLFGIFGHHNPAQAAEKQEGASSSSGGSKHLVDPDALRDKKIIHASKRFVNSKEDLISVEKVQDIHHYHDAPVSSPVTTIDTASTDNVDFVEETPSKYADKLVTDKKISFKSRREFNPLLLPTDRLSPIVGTEPVTRAEATKLVWEYIHKQNLQDSKQKKMIHVEGLLKNFIPEEMITMTTLPKYLSNELKNKVNYDGPEQELATHQNKTKVITKYITKKIIIDKNADTKKMKALAEDIPTTDEKYSAKHVFNQPVIPTEKISHLVGTEVTTRSDAVKKVWKHIHKNDLQDKKNKKLIHIDEALSKFIPDKTEISMFDLPKYIAKQLYASAEVITKGSDRKVIQLKDK